MWPACDRPLTVVRGGFLVDGDGAAADERRRRALGEHMDEVFADLPPRAKAKAGA